MEKTYVFDTAEKGFDSPALLASLMQNRGVDPNLMALLSNASKNQDCWGGNGCWFIWVILMFWLWGGNRNGFGFNNGAEGIPNQLNNDFGREVLLQAINGNQNAISQLSTTLGCNTNALQTAIGQVQSSLQSIGSQVGMTGQQIINSVQAGTCQIGNQLAQCCCNIQDSITRQGYENQIATLNQTNSLNNTMTINNQAVLAKLDSLSNQALLDKIDMLREKNSTLLAQLSNEHQTAIIQASQAQALAPVNAALSMLQSEVNNIKCKIPETITIPQNTGTYLSPCQATVLGLNGFGFNGFNNGSIWS